MLTTAYATGTTTAIFPSKGVHATCIDCEKEVISKCGTEVVHHFAHRPGVICNTRFHDGKTEWHVRWQRTVVPDLAGINVEVPITKDGSIKRADLISNSNYVIEFQHSHLPKPERMEREKHYGNVIWVVHTDKKNSKTWKHLLSRARVFFNGDDNIVHWVSINRNVGSPNTFTMQKERFIKTVINNPHYTDSIINIIELRQRIHSNATIEYYNRKSDERDTSRYSYFMLRSNYYAAAHYIIKEFETIERYHAQLESERLGSIRKQNELNYLLQKQAREDATTFKKEQRQIKDPALLQTLLKLEIESTEGCFVTERNIWLRAIENELLQENKTRLEAKLKLEREREAEIAKQINTEITNNRINQLSKETQERIRIDLIRSKGKLEYAAELARKRLEELGIDYADESIRISYGVGTQ
jgi:RNA binding exosome subunit